MESRDKFVKSMIEEFVGPGSEGPEIGQIDYENERISESPLYRYFLGVLYPQKFEEAKHELDMLEGDDNMPETETDPYPKINDVKTKRDSSDLNMDEDSDIGSNIVKDIYAFAPSACSMTFFVNDGCDRLTIEISSAKYESLPDVEAYVILSDAERAMMEKYRKVGSFTLDKNKLFFVEYIKDVKFEEISHKTDYERLLAKANNFRKNGFRRIPIKFTHDFQIKQVKDEEDVRIAESELKLKIKIRKRQNKRHVVTVSLINSHVNKADTKSHSPKLCYFQNSIKVSIAPDDKSSNFLEIDDIQIGDLENPAEKMLFRNKKIFAVGHGCSVAWDGDSPKSLNTTFIPVHISPSFATNPKRIRNLNLNIFSLKELGWGLNKKEAISQLNIFVDDYKNWLNQEFESMKESKEFIKPATKNYNECLKIIERIREGVNIINKNQNAWIAFQDANKAMLMQKYQTDNFLNKIQDGYVIRTENTNIVYQDLDLNYAWRPFQLAFILLSVKSIVEPESEDRCIADLIWFPTGGGKTEAYLGLIAFTIFYNRMQDERSHGGTMVIMRYTLRLLTADQFKRASTLIMACEYLRRESTKRYGYEEISIGFWVGSGVTDNKINDSIKYVKDFHKNTIKSELFIQNYKFQITHCPWCGSSLINKENATDSGFVIETRPQGLSFKCTNPNCKFYDHLPFQVIDESLYKKPPTLLFGTVDKFAILAWKPEARSFFGFSKDKKGNVVRQFNPPTLIIQDELHLISSALGSIFGHYESMIDFLCTEKDILPKIVCSTATIKKADEQVRAVFNREMAVFPPPAFCIEDSYFSQETNIDDANPGRMYVGFCSIGKTLSTTFIKLIVLSLLHRKNVPTQRYSTIVSYFNTIRDIGQAAGFMRDSVDEQLKVAANRRNYQKENIKWDELTSRLEGNELPKLLRELKSTKNPLSVLLTTNMFSVGVDIPTLNIMIMNGQPKSTSEYIQATSRVGRQDPGLVFTLFDNYRPRDKSHYENFKAYHQSFYRFVEPSGVTPFSRPVRLRALHTLVIIFVRMFLFDDNNTAHLLNIRQLEVNPLWRQFLEYLKNRCSIIDQTQTNLLSSEIEDFLREWITWANAENFVYTNRKRIGEDPVLLDGKLNPLMIPSGMHKAKWENCSKHVMESMRNVDSTIYANLED